MAGNIADDDDDVIASINMVPFIDICLVLLIIFMVTSSYIARAAFEVELPRAAAGTEVAPSTLLIEVSAEGQVMVNGQPTTLEALPAQVRAESTRDESVQAIIAGDRRIDYGLVVDIIDIIKQNGVKAFALNIEREAAAP